MIFRDASDILKVNLYNEYYSRSFILFVLLCWSSIYSCFMSLSFCFCLSLSVCDLCLSILMYIVHSHSVCVSMSLTVYDCLSLLIYVYLCLSDHVNLLSVSVPVSFLHIFIEIFCPLNALNSVKL